MRLRSAIWMAATVVTCVLAAPRASDAGDDDAADFTKCTDTIRRSADPVERFNAVRRLGTLTDDRVSERLARLVRADADPGLRLEAAHALATVPNGKADRVVLELVAGGGPREIREALAVVLRDRGVPVKSLVAELDTDDREPLARCRLTDALAAYPDVMAAAHLERLARLWNGPTRDAALRALERQPRGSLLLADLVSDLLATSADLDTIVEALDVAERHGDDRVATQAERIRALGLAEADAALEVAVAHIAERRLLKSGGAPAKPARVRDRVDHVHVAHQGRDLQRVWDNVRADLMRARLKFEDVRVGCELYLEPSATRPSRDENRLPFTRDLAKVDKFFGDIIYQTKRGTGVGMTEALESAFDLPSWRWDAERVVVLYADASPRGLARAVIPASIHRIMDGTALSVFFFARNADDVPGPVREVAKSGGVDVTVIPPAGAGGSTADGGTADSGAKADEVDPLDRRGKPPPGTGPGKKDGKR
ncbi:MAG: HEAT repeat domain-containing protein [Planctomycetes bacterium]|nr:HEAT repeat domain-containing protein [Planctomycetota bacterium]